jgi:hypothetical protein
MQAGRGADLDMSTQVDNLRDDALTGQLYEWLTRSCG